ncbi:MAG: hypothetical protein CR217_15575 [Beijerinckiaceae bacterium]|nr:MAG: hypothetical protein CR217_15575 [Beijerinckiaceae bacterium]
MGKTPKRALFATRGSPAKAARLPPGLWAPPHGQLMAGSPARYRRGGFGALKAKPLLGRLPRLNVPAKTDLRSGGHRFSFIMTPPCYRGF